MLKGPNVVRKSITMLPEIREYLKYLKMFIVFSVCLYKLGEPPFPEIRLAIGQITAKSHIVMTHIIRHVLYDS